jgi:hypothetical protein
VSLVLSAQGQIATAPEPAAILGALCAHSVLERVEYPRPAFRFDHQQVQELFAATELTRLLYELGRGDDSEARRRYTHDYVNQPVWEEPLRMVAEEIGAQIGTVADAVVAVAAGVRLVEMALLVDPVFAAELSRLCGPSVWERLGGRVGERLRAWYGTADQNHQQCALAAMIATGSEDFVDIVVPLLSGGDQQGRLKTYRAWGDFHLTTLGPDWRSLVGGWNDEQRSEFVAEVVRGGRLVEVAEEFARSDASPKVRRVALQALEWVGAREATSRVVSQLDDPAFEQVLRERVVTVPAEVKVRALDAYQKLVASTGDIRERIEMRLVAAELGSSSVLDGLREDVSSWARGRVDGADEMLLRSALEVLRGTDSAWINRWVVERIADGSLWPDRWVTLVTDFPDDLKEGLFAKLCAGSLEQGDEERVITVLRANIGADFIKRALSVLCRISTETGMGVGEERERRWAIRMQLQELIRAVPPDIAVAGTLSGLSATLNGVEYEVVAELFGRVNNDEAVLRGQLREELRQGIRRYLKDGISFALSQDDFGGGLKAEVAIALARIGEPEDMSDLERLVRADIERVRGGRAARVRGERSAAADGAVMSWSTWHVRALMWLDIERAEEVLLTLLSEFEYEQDASAALVRMARTQTTSRLEFSLDRLDYSIVWDRRQGRPPTGLDDGRRRRYATAIRQRMAAIMEARSGSDDPDSFNGRLKGLAANIAALDGRGSADFVMEILALPGNWDGWTRVGAMEALVLGGARLSAEAALRVVNPTIDHMLTQSFHDQQASFLLRRCLSVLAFIEPCSVGVARIREGVATPRFARYELREIVTALGQSRCNDALDLLLELATSSAGREFQSLATEWIDALAALGTQASTRVLLGFVDPDIEHPALEQYFEYVHRKRLASRIVEAAQSEPGVKDRLYSLCRRELPQTMRVMLADVLASLGTRDALIGALDLIHDGVNPAVPYELLQGIENVFLERRPYGESGHVYTLEPRSANEIRSRLFGMMLSDGSRKRSAWALLGQIESWRLEYGRPASEPRHPAFDSGSPWPPIELAGEIGGTSAGA